jgi:hypothetical protein
MNKLRIFKISYRLPPFDATSQNTFAPRRFLKSIFSWNVSSTMAFTLVPNLQYIGFPRWHSVFLKVFWNKMRYNSDKRLDFVPFFSKNRTSLQENHFAIYKINYTGFVNVMQDRFRQPQYDTH